MFIINQDMPKNCFECPFREECECKLTKTNLNPIETILDWWFKERAKDCPLVEIIPGKWEFAGIDVSGFPRYSCSKCNMLNFIRTQYCPNCGAIMTITK